MVVLLQYINVKHNNNNNQQQQQGIQHSQHSQGAVDTQLEFVAIKQMNIKKLRNNNIFDRILNEIHIHKQCQHVNIIEYIDSFQDDINIYMVLNYCNGGNLYQYLHKYGTNYPNSGTIPGSPNGSSGTIPGSSGTNHPIKSLPIELIHRILTNIINGVAYLHDRNILHRDLKLSNVLLEYAPNTHTNTPNTPTITRITLCDFGLCTQSTHPDDEQYTFCGTPNYIPPEIIYNQELSHGKPVDIWSIGVMCYTIAVGKPPFDAGNDNNAGGNTDNTGGNNGNDNNAGGDNGNGNSNNSSDNNSGIMDRGDIVDFGVGGASRWEVSDVEVVNTIHTPNTPNTPNTHNTHNISNISNISNTSSTSDNNSNINYNGCDINNNHLTIATTATSPMQQFNKTIYNIIHTHIHVPVILINNPDYKLLIECINSCLIKV